MIISKCKGKREENYKMVFTEKEEEWKDGETTNPTTDVQNVVNEGRFTAVKVKKVLMVIDTVSKTISLTDSLDEIRQHLTIII